jgi:hypothetical protein
MKLRSWIVRRAGAALARLRAALRPLPAPERLQRPAAAWTANEGEPSGPRRVAASAKCAPILTVAQLRDW